MNRHGTRTTHTSGRHQALPQGRLLSSAVPNCGFIALPYAAKVARRLFTSVSHPVYMFVCVLLCHIVKATVQIVVPIDCMRGDCHILALLNESLICGRT